MTKVQRLTLLLGAVAVIVLRGFRRTKVELTRIDRDTTSSSSEWTKRNNNNTLVCETIGVHSASRLWRDHFEDILLPAFQNHPLDKDGVHHAWIERFLRAMDPTQQRSGRRRSLSPTDLQNMLSILEARRSNASAPPLSVAIFGGSVTEGRGCQNLPVELDPFFSSTTNLPPIRGGTCAWPSRLQHLADAVLGPNMVHIHNLAVGGTNTALSIPIIDYHLYPLHQPPDVMVNAYSVNDNLFDWRGTADNTQSYDHLKRTLHKAQAFVRTARQSKPCQTPPVVLFVDEYVGNQNKKLLGEDIRNDGVRLVADYYEMGYVRRSDQAHILVQTNETLLSPSWFKNDQWATEVHFGMPGHVQMALVTAYYVLEEVVQYCQEKPPTTTASSERLPPPLDFATPWSTLPSLWRTTAAPTTTDRAHDCAKTAWTHAPPCPLAFVATPTGTAKSPLQLHNYLKSFVQSNTGWLEVKNKRDGWQNKLGYVATEKGAKVTMVLESLENRVRVVTLQFMKSYGDLWDGSEAEFVVQIHRGDVLKHTETFRLEGYHQSNTSISYEHVQDLGEHYAELGDRLTFSMELVAGPQFKVMALMLCSR